jgi:hypothetical protein
MEFLPKFLTYLVGLLIVVIVVGGVALPAIWSRDPKRRKAATAVLVLLADTTRVIGGIWCRRPARHYLRWPPAPRGRRSDD